MHIPKSPPRSSSKWARRCWPFSTGDSPAIISRCERRPAERRVSPAEPRLLLVCKDTHANKVAHSSTIILLSANTTERKQVCKQTLKKKPKQAVSHMWSGEPAASTRGRSRIKVFFLGTFTLQRIPHYPATYFSVNSSDAHTRTHTKTNLAINSK